MPYKYVTDARQVYKALNGVFVIYKPVAIWYNQISQTIINNLCKGYNLSVIYNNLLY